MLRTLHNNRDLMLLDSFTFELHGLHSTFEFTDTFLNTLDAFQRKIR